MSVLAGVLLSRQVGRKNYILQDVRAEIVECQRELEREKLRREKEERLKTKIASYIKPLRQRNLELENLVAKREDREVRGARLSLITFSSLFSLLAMPPSLSLGLESR